MSPPTRLHNIVNFGGWDPLPSLWYLCKFRRVSRLGSVTARHSSSGRQPNFAALNRGRHLYSAGRPSRWVLAHISSLLWLLSQLLDNVIEVYLKMRSTFIDIKASSRATVLTIHENPQVRKLAVSFYKRFSSTKLNFSRRNKISHR